MKQVFLSELSLGSKFRIFEDGCIWIVLDVNPPQYCNSFRASSGRITAPFNRNLLVFV